MAKEGTPPQASVGTEAESGAAWGNRVEIAKRNAYVMPGIAGTCVAIFTFLLFFLYPRLLSGEVSPILFRLTVGVIVLTLFFFMYAGSYYYTFVGSLGRDDRSRSIEFIDRADRSAVVALVLFVLAPALILFTINLPDLGSFALFLWIVYLAVLIVDIRRP
jgi:hypothetical protein